MDSNRIIINSIDLSTSNMEETTVIAGYTVVRAPKGPRTPVRIPAGGTSKLQDIFGTASKEYPELYEAQSFISDYDLYISSPYKDAKIPVAYITGDGIFPGAELVTYNSQVEDLVNGIDEPEINGITVVDAVKVLKDVRYPKSGLGIKDATDNGSDYPKYKLSDGKGILTVSLGVTKSYLTEGTTFRIQGLPTGTNKLREYYIDNNYIDFAVDADGNVNQTGSDDTSYLIGSLVNSKDEDFATATDTDLLTLKLTGYTPAEGKASPDGILAAKYIIDFLATEASRQALTVYYLVELDNDDVRGTILPKYPSDRDLHISFTSFNENRGYDGNTVAGRNIIKMSVYEDDAFHNKNYPVSIEGSLVSSAKSESGASIGFNDSNVDYSNQNLICVVPIAPFDSLTQITNKVVTTYPSITLAGGYKDSKYTEDFTSLDLHNIGWELAKSDEYSDVDLFFDATSGMKSDGEINRESNTFFTLANSLQSSGFIFNYTIAPTAITNEGMLSYGSQYWNICNEAILVLSNSDKINSPMTGAYAKMIARILENRWGGVAPMYLNSGTPSMGGQIDVNPLRLRYRYDKDQQTALDDINFNPIILDHTYGIMVVGQKTCKSGAITDWSYIGHVASFLNFFKEMKVNVMIPQLGKANNDYYRTLRQQQTEQLLDKRLSGNDRIWADAIVDTSTREGLNSSENRNARKFLIEVRVKVDTFSEFVILNFYNVDQSVELSTSN